MSEFPASWNAFEMLRRLVFRGNMSNFNAEIAAELIEAGLARIEGDELAATEAGFEAERSLMKLPCRSLAA